MRTIPTSSPEFHSKRGQEAIMAEVNDLRADVVWDDSTVAEWSEVRHIKKDGFTPTSGLVFSILGQKNAELAGKVADRECPYPARAVFQGSNVRTGDGTPAWMLY